MRPTTTLLELKELAGNAPTSFDALQLFFAPYVHEIALFWWGVWCVTAAVLVVHIAQEYRDHKK